MKRFLFNKKYLLSIGLALILGLAACTDSKEDPRLKLFLEKYKKMSSTDLYGYEWLKEPSPFFPYIDTGYDHGLAPDQAKRYQDALNRKDCEAILDLEQEGFFKLYPFLRPAFERDNIPAVEKGDLIYILRKNIIRIVSPASRYCAEHNRISETFAFAQKHSFSFPPVRSASSPKNKRPAISDIKQRMFTKRCRAMGALIKLAIFDEYSPAIMSLLQLIDQPSVIVLQPNVEYYLRKIAGQLGVKQTNKKSHDRRLRSSLSPKTRMALDIKSTDHNPTSSWWHNLKCQIDSLK